MSFGAEIKDFLTAFSAGAESALSSRKIALQERYYDSQEKAAESTSRLRDAQIEALNKRPASMQRQEEDAFAAGRDNAGGGAIPTDVPGAGGEPEGAIENHLESFLGSPQAPLIGGDDEEDAEPAKHMAYLTGKGTDPLIAAALVGNAYQESGLRSKVHGDKGAAYGLYQFHSNGRRPAFQQWVAENKRDMASSDAQHDFVLHDLQANFPKVYEKMVNAETVGQATEAFMKGYERPSHAALPNRLQAAEDAFNVYSQMNQAGPESAAPRTAIPTE